MPSGFLPPSFEGPGGSSRHGTPDVWRAFLTTSFNSASLTSLPALSLHVRLWRQSVLALPPHLQACDSLTGAPILKATDTVKVLASHSVTDEVTGITWSHVPGSESAGASNIALSTGLDPSKSVSNLALHFGSSQALCSGLDFDVWRSVQRLNSSHILPAFTNTVLTANPFPCEDKASTKELVAWAENTNAESETSTARLNPKLSKRTGNDTWLLH